MLVITQNRGPRLNSLQLTSMTKYTAGLYIRQSPELANKESSQSLYIRILELEVSRNSPRRPCEATHCEGLCHLSTLHTAPIDEPSIRATQRNKGKTGGHDFSSSSSLESAPSVSTASDQQIPGDRRSLLALLSATLPRTSQLLGCDESIHRITPVFDQLDRRHQAVYRTRRTRQIHRPQAKEPSQRSGWQA